MVMKTRVAVALASSLLVVGGVAGQANAQTDPGPDPNEGGVTETADLDEGTEMPDPDDAVDSPEEAGENAEGEAEEVDAGEEPTATEAETADVDESSAPETLATQLVGDDEDDDDEVSDDASDEAATNGAGSDAGSSVSDSAIAAQPTFTG